MIVTLKLLLRKICTFWTNRDCFVASTWVMMNMDTKVIQRITDSIRAEYAPWARDPPM